MLSISRTSAYIYYLSKAPHSLADKIYEVTSMNHKNLSSAGTLHEQGTPFYTFTPEGHTGVPTVRVMPSRFSFPVLPAACTFIRDLGTDNGSSLF